MPIKIIGSLNKQFFIDFPIPADKQQKPFWLQWQKLIMGLSLCCGGRDNLIILIFNAYGNITALNEILGRVEADFKITPKIISHFLMISWKEIKL